jgi:hypothetical protein
MSESNLRQAQVSGIEAQTTFSGSWTMPKLISVWSQMRRETADHAADQYSAGFPAGTQRYHSIRRAAVGGMSRKS